MTLTFPTLRLSDIRIHPLVPIMAGALVLRMFLLGNAALWYDETGSVWMASMPFNRMIDATAGDTHPPLYFSLLWIWIRVFGSSEAVVRFPSVVLSLISIGLTWRLGQRLGLGRPVLIMASAIMAVTPAQIHFAQEARMYALFTVLVQVALLAALDRRWWLYCLAVSLSLWTHNYGLVFAAVLAVVSGVCMVIECRENNIPVVFSKPSTLWLAANAVALASWLPWLTSLAFQMREVAQGYWIQAVMPGTILDVLFNLTWGLVIVDEIQGHALVALCGLLAFALAAALKHRSRPILILACLVVSPFAIVTVASVIWKPIMLFRGFMPLTPWLTLWIAWALVEGMGPRARWVAAAFTLPVLAAVLAVYYVNVPTQKGDPAIWTDAIEWREGDVLYHINEGSYMFLRFYTPDDWRVAMLPRGDWRNIGALSDRTKNALGFNSARLEDMDWRRAWVIQSSGPTTVQGEDDAIAQLLARWPHELRMEITSASTYFALYLFYNPVYAR